MGPRIWMGTGMRMEMGWGRGRGRRISLLLRRRSPSATRRQELKGLVQPHHQAAADISMEMSRFWD